MTRAADELTRDPARIPLILAVLDRAWRKNPQLRLGQLIVNAAASHQAFYIKDDELFQRLNAYPVLPTQED